MNALMNHRDPQNAGFLTRRGPVSFTIKTTIQVVILPFTMSGMGLAPNLICDSRGGAWYQKVMAQKAKITTHPHLGNGHACIEPHVTY